jgi:hypothetical protein
VGDGVGTEITADAAHAKRKPAFQSNADRAPSADPGAGGAATGGDAIAAAGGSGDVDVHVGYDFSVSYPWQAQFTVVLRNVNLLTLGDPKKIAVDLFHEPNLSLTLDPKSGLSMQQMIALLNVHWIPPWQREIEIPISVFINEATTKQPVTGGAQGQVEQHIVDWFSITASMSGTIGGGSIFSANAGVLFHIH